MPLSRCRSSKTAHWAPLLWVISPFSFSNIWFEYTALYILHPCILRGNNIHISLDVALTITKTFRPSNPPQALHNTPLFVLTGVTALRGGLCRFGYAERSSVAVVLRFGSHIICPIATWLFVIEQTKRLLAISCVVLSLTILFRLSAPDHLRKSMAPSLRCY